MPGYEYRGITLWQPNTEGKEGATKATNKGTTFKSKHMLEQGLQIKTKSKRKATADEKKVTFYF